MAKKALGRDLGHLLSEARPTRVLENSTAGTKPLRPDTAPETPTAPPSVRPEAPFQAQPADSTDRQPSLFRVPPARPDPTPVPTTAPVPGPAAAVPRPVPPHPHPPQARYGRKPGSPSSPPSPVDAPPGPAWLYFLFADLLLMGLAVYLFITLPFGRTWSFALAGACAVLGAIVAGLIPTVRQGKRPPPTPTRIRPDRPRVFVQLTRL